MADTAIVPQNQQPRQFNFEGNILNPRFDAQGDPIFDATEVCKILSIKNVSDALDRLDDDETTIIVSSDNGVPVRHLMLTLPGLNHLISTTRPRGVNAEIVRKFQRWLNHEVLPSIYNTGSYSLQNVSSEDLIVLLAQQNVETKKQIETLRLQQSELYEKQADQAVHLDAIDARLDDADYYSVRGWCRKQALSYTQSLLIKWGKEATALSRHRSIERKETMEDDIPVHRYHKSILIDVCIPKPKQNDQLRLV